VLAVVAVLVVGALAAATTRARGDGEAPEPVATASPPDVAVTDAVTAPVTVPAGPPAPAACAPPTLEGLAASVLMVGMPGVVDAEDPLVDDLVDLGVGGVLLNRTNVASQAQLRALTAGLAARFGGHLTIALDEEGGRVSPLSTLGLGGPSARRLAQRGVDAIELAGRESGTVAADLGATMLLGPVADLDDGPSAGIIGDRSFGTDPDVVGEAARRYAAGVRAAGIDAAAKHWPGYAGAPDTHLGAGTTTVDGEELVGRHVAAFVPALDDGIPAVMVSHVVYPSLGPLPASLNPAAYDLLRQNGYEGPALTDALGMGAIHTRWGFDRSGALALVAGADVALSNQGGDARVLRDGIVAAVATGELSETRLREAATRAATVRPGC
jgi:beta-N-acetylhexosaminidase